MAASGREILTFFVGVGLAGLAPVAVLPGLELEGILALVADQTVAVPLEHAAFVLFLALLAAAWFDTDGGRPDPDLDRWD